MFDLWFFSVITFLLILYIIFYEYSYDFVGKYNVI